MTAASGQGPAGHNAWPATPVNAAVVQLTGLSPALRITAEGNVLRGEGEAHARGQMQAVVTAPRFFGTIHGSVTPNRLATRPRRSQRSRRPDRPARRGLQRAAAFEAARAEAVTRLEDRQVPDAVYTHASLFSAAELTHLACIRPLDLQGVDRIKGGARSEEGVECNRSGQAADEAARIRSKPRRGGHDETSCKVRPSRHTCEPHLRRCHANRTEY